jgi:N-acetylmuramoyl-L-alanine amidase
MSRRLAVIAVLGLLAVGCSDGGALGADASGEPSGSSTTVASSSTTSTVPPTTSVVPTTTTTTLPPLVDDGAPRVAITATGVVGAVVRPLDGGRVVMTSPCGNEVAVRAIEVVSAAHVVLDPGHGGSETGAVGPGGLRESDLNLAIAELAKQELEARGVRVVLTRSADYRITLASRAQIATVLDAEAFVSIHHNAGPTHTQDTPGSEVYYQSTGGEASKRLGGLIYEEAVAAFAPYDVEWAAFREAQVKVRLSRDGGDYYGILRRSAGVPAALAELAYVTNPPEEALLRTPEFQAVEAKAIARAVLRFLTTDDPGTGFVGPSDRSEPAGPGGGGDGCVDPRME